jgi:hypothetical protein
MSGFKMVGVLTYLCQTFENVILLSALMSPFQDVKIFSASHLLPFFQSELIGDVLQTFHFLQKTGNWKVAEFWKEKFKL